MSQTSTLKGQCIAEFLGTGLLIFFGVGCVAALKVAGASFGQWEISVIWGLGVAMAIYLTAGVAGGQGTNKFQWTNIDWIDRRNQGKLVFCCEVAEGNAFPPAGEISTLIPPILRVTEKKGALCNNSIGRIVLTSA